MIGFVYTRTGQEVTVVMLWGEGGGWQLGWNRRGGGVGHDFLNSVKEWVVLFSASFTGMNSADFEPQSTTECLFLKHNFESFPRDSYPGTLTY